MRRRSNKGGNANTTTVPAVPATTEAPVVEAPVATELETGITVPDGGFNISPLMGELGKVEEPDNMPKQRARVSRLKFFWPTNSDAEEARKVIGEAINVGHPYVNCDGEVFDAIKLSYLVLVTPFFYSAVDDAEFKPRKVWLEEQEWGATDGGKKIQARANAVVLLLPGPDGFMHDDLLPAQVAVTVAKGAKAPAISAHYSAALDVADGGTKLLKFSRANPSHVKLPEAFRLASTFRVTTLPGANGTYAKIRAIPKPITELQWNAVQAFFADEACQDEREAAEDDFARTVSELKALVS